MRREKYIRENTIVDKKRGKEVVSKKKISKLTGLLIQTKLKPCSGLILQIWLDLCYL